MKLPFGRKRAPTSKAAKEDQRAINARDEALNRMKGRVADARLAADPEAVVPAVLQPPPEPVPAAPPVPSQGNAESTEGAADPPAPAGDSADPLKGLAGDGGLDSGLLDLFIEAKVETDEASLAAELEDVSIGELLGEVMVIGDRLGIDTSDLPAKRDQVIQSRAERPTVPEETPLAERRPEINVVPATAPDDPVAEEPDPIDDAALAALAARRVVVPEEGPAESDKAEDQEPPLVVKRVEPSDQPVAKASGRSDMHGFYLIAVGAVGLGLALTTSIGISFAKEEGQPVEDAAVLSMVTFPVEPAVGSASIIHPEPVEPQVGQSALMAPATPRPELSADPAQPRPERSSFDGDRAAYFTYTIEDGDSLTSISNEFGICPEHIIWNNGGDLADGGLRAGRELTLPGYPGLIHKVRAGDTVQRLADEYNTTAAAVIAYPGNNLKSASDLSPGDTILLPGGFPDSVLRQSEDERIAYTHPSESGYIWPFYGPITSYYGEQRPGYTHTATDIGGLFKWGAPVLAVADGEVVVALQDHPGLGNYVVVAHDDGTRSLYAHLSSIAVEQGDGVRIGTRLGGLGCTGLSTGTHLHFELWRDGKPLDALDYLDFPAD